MDDLVVTRFWMLGVIAVMVIFAGIALVGIARDNKGRRDSSGS